MDACERRPHRTRRAGARRAKAPGCTRPRHENSTGTIRHRAAWSHAEPATRLLGELVGQLEAFSRQSRPAHSAHWERRRSQFRRGPSRWTIVRRANRPSGTGADAEPGPAVQSSARNARRHCTEPPRMDSGAQVRRLRADRGWECCASFVTELVLWSRAVGSSSSRSEIDWTSRFPEVVEAVRRLPCRSRIDPEEDSSRTVICGWYPYSFAVSGTTCCDRSQRAEELDRSIDYCDPLGVATNLER